MKNADRILLPFLLLALVATALPAQATVARFFSLGEHVEASQLIVRARATGERTFISEQDGRPRTDRRFTVLESWKGSLVPGKEFVVRQMRGRTSEGELRIPGDPELREGDEVVLFLVMGKEGVTYLTALAQSKYAVTRDRSGAWAKRDFEGLTFSLGDDRAVAPPAEAATPLELLAAAVRALVSG